jgi:hypothetical protein
MYLPIMQSSAIPAGTAGHDLLPAAQMAMPLMQNPLVLHELFQSRSLMLQYLNGVVCADGNISIFRRGTDRFEPVIRIYQSNLAFLTAVNMEFNNTGYIAYHGEAGMDPNVNEGRYSQGEHRQVLSFFGKAAVDVAAELAPFTVTKKNHFETVLEMLNQPDGPVTKEQYSVRMQCFNSKPEDNTLEVKNITAEWLAGMFDGDGCICVKHNEKAGRSHLVLNITQSKSLSLLFAIKEIYPGTIAHNPHRLLWATANNIPAVYKALSKNLVLKRQKLDTILQHVFNVDITRDPVKGAGQRGAFSCPNTMKGWTASAWRTYLREPFLSWSR